MKVIVFTISIIVILGGLYFYQQTWNTYTEKVPKKSLEEFVKQAPNSSQGSTEQKQENIVNTPQNQSSFLARLLNPSLFIGGGDETIDASYGITQDPKTQKLKEGIRNYLIASSDINFPSASKLEPALEKAEEGDPADLIEISSDYKEGLEELKQLVPPEIMQKIHAYSIEVVERFVSLLNNTIHQTSGSVYENWNSEERLAITELAEQTKAAMIEIVTTYQIRLPSGVLSY